MLFWMIIYPRGMLAEEGESWTPLSGGYWGIHPPGGRVDIPHLGLGGGVLRLKQVIKFRY